MRLCYWESGRRRIKTITKNNIDDDAVDDEDDNGNDNDNKDDDDDWDSCSWKHDGSSLEA